MLSNFFRDNRTPPCRKSTQLRVLFFFISKNRFFKIFSFAQNRFQIFDVDISMFEAPEKSPKISKNAIHV